MRLALLTALTAFSAFTVDAQSGWVEGRYYENRGSDSVTCSAPYQVVEGYNAWGQPYGRYYQACRRMVWTSWWGSRQGYRWSGYHWVSYWDTRTWWTYSWYDFVQLA